MDKLKKKFESEDHEINPQELNYKVGNTSGMDVGQVPAEIAERVGNLAQRGGGEMEILLNNPTTFQIDREDLYNTIEGLEIDISLHSDPNIGYTSGYKTGQGRGFDVTRSYFTKYLREYASFKREAEERQGLNFRLGRINPHISTDQMPALKERMAQDIGLDPFGFPISEYQDQFIDMRDEMGQNIFRNPNFLKNFYKAFILSEVDDEYQIYGLFQRFSSEFREKWREAQAKAANDFWRDITDISNVKEDDELSEKAAMLQSARMQDQGIEVAWLDLIRESDEGEEVKLEDSIEIPESISSLSKNIQSNIPRKIERIEDFSVFGINPSLGAVGQTVYSLENDPLADQFRRTVENAVDDPRIDEERKEQVFEDIEDLPSNSEVKEAGLKLLRNAMNKLWEGNGNDFLISVDTKLGVLQSRLDIQQTQILEMAQEEDLEDHALAVMRGDEDYFEPEGAETKTPTQKHIDLLNALMNSFEQALWMESNLFYKIIPAWMSCSDYSKQIDGDTVHEAFEAPEFIWEVLVEREHDVDSFGEKYLKKLESDHGFRQDVAAASAAVFVWSHFTQIEAKFDVDGYQYIESDECTWVEWMNEYGIGVNFEAMYGSPNEELKIWRSKDIVAAARAINITSRKKLDEIHQDMFNAPAKFTIDMEHVSSFGADPWRDIEDLIEMENWIAQNNNYDVIVDEDRPLAPMMRMYHLTKPGNETRQSASGHTHGPFRHGDIQLYTWLHDMVKNGFTQSDERASVMYEVGGEMTGTVQKAKLSMNMIELGIEPDKVDPARVDPGKEYETEEEALIARFFGMDRPSFNQEWAKIEQHAFDPLQGLLEATQFDYTWTSNAATQKRGNRPQEWQAEEYR
ncbi:MAG: hypothetical protein R6V35_02145 [Candidatus Nanohaloarchaea archaeon]